MIIKFSGKIYKLGAIESAVKAYRELADFKISRKSGCFEVKLDNVDKSVKDVIKDEFCNYVLALMKSSS